MTVRISPDYAKRIFDELPGRTRSEKAKALTALIAALRVERDTFVAPPRRPRTVEELLPEITGKSLGHLANLNAYVDGLSVPVTTLVNAYLMPGNALYDVARSAFGAVGLTVVVEPQPARGRPITRLVTKAQAALAKAVVSRETLETMLADRKPFPWFVSKVEIAKVLGGKGGDA